MAILKPKHINHPKYDCRTVNNINGFIGYCIKLYCIYADCRVYTIYSQEEWIDTLNLMRESGTMCSSFTHDIYVTPTHHHDIFKEIQEFVDSCV